MRVLKKFKVGEPIPAGAVFIEKSLEKGEYLGEEVVGHFGIFPFNGTRYRDVYAEVPVYIYEVEAES